MELLAPLARRSRIVTALLASEMGVLTRLLTVVSEPLTLSLGTLFTAPLYPLIQHIKHRGHSQLCVTDHRPIKNGNHTADVVAFEFGIWITPSVAFVHVRGAYSLLQASLPAAASAVVAL